MIKNPLLHPNWSDVETLRHVLANFNAAGTSLAHEYSKGGFDGTGTTYSLVRKAITNALIEIFDWAGFSQPLWWSARVAEVSLDSGENFQYAYEYIVNFEGWPRTDFYAITKTGV